MTKRSALLSLAATAALTLSLAACGGSSDQADQPSSPANGSNQPAVDLGFEPVTAGKLTVCTNPPYWPFEDTDAATGQVIGFDMDLMAEVAKDLDLELVPRETPFEAIESAASLNVNDCDAGASALTITAARAAKLEFSDSYYDTTMGLLVRKDSGITSLADLQGKAVGVQQGTTGEEWAHEQSELTNIKQFEGLGDQVTALKAGEVDGVFNDEPTLTPYEADGTLVVASTFDTEERLGFAVKQGNSALLAHINQTLARLKADSTYLELQTKWFAGQGN